MYEENSDHFFKKNLDNNTWDEFENNVIISRFQLQTFISGGLILQGLDSNKYVELTDFNANIAFGSIELLSEKTNFYNGSWVYLNRNERKINIFFY